MGENKKPLAAGFLQRRRVQTAMKLVVPSAFQKLTFFIFIVALFGS